MRTYELELNNPSVVHAASFWLHLIKLRTVADLERRVRELSAAITPIREECINYHQVTK